MTNAQLKVRLTDKTLKANHNLAECLDNIFRYQIVEKNSELKIRHGYAVSRSNDIQSMKLQGAMTLFCANVKRI